MIDLGQVPRGHDASHYETKKLSNLFHSSVPSHHSELAAVEPHQWIHGDIAVGISAASTRTTTSNCLRQSRLQCRCTNFMEQSVC